jgi:hypothetical protein
MSADHHRFALFVSLLVSSCTGALDGAPAGPGTVTAPGSSSEQCPPPAGSNEATWRVWNGLKRNCAGCHNEGEIGYFASIHAFESLLVNNAELVTPGDSENSALIALLEGRRMGSSFTQMPLSGSPFAELAERGETDITMEEVRDWINNLQVSSVSIRPDPAAPAVQRISALHIDLGLRELLGLTDEDFFQEASEYGVVMYASRSEDRFPVRGNRPPVPHAYFRANAALANSDVSASFIQGIVPISQAWCGMALAKSGNPLFRVASINTGIADRELLREEIANWHLLFLAESGSDEEIDEIVDDVFAPREMESGTTRAWVGTCSFFIRHPRFVFY